MEMSFLLGIRTREKVGCLSQPPKRTHPIATLLNVLLTIWLIFGLTDVAAQQSTRAPCTANSQGNSNTLVLVCPGVDPKIVKGLLQRLQALQGTADRIEATQLEANRLLSQYFEFRANLERLAASGPNAERAWEALANFEFESVAKLQKVLEQKVTATLSRLELRDFQGFANAIARFDASLIEKYETEHNIRPDDIRRALGLKSELGGTTVEEFFRSSVVRPAAYDWLQAKINDGFDPNSPIELGDKKFTSLFWGAVDARNLQGAERVLSMGASPHSPSTIRGSTGFPRYGWPLEYIAGLKWPDIEPQRALIERMIRSGAILELSRWNERDLSKVGNVRKESVTACEYVKTERCQSSKEVCNQIKALLNSYDLSYFSTGAAFAPKYILSATSDILAFRGYSSYNPLGLAHASLVHFYPRKGRAEVFEYKYDGCGRYQSCWTSFDVEFDGADGSIFESYPKRSPMNSICRNSGK